MAGEFQRKGGIICKTLISWVRPACKSTSGRQPSCCKRPALAMTKGNKSVAGGICVSSNSGQPSFAVIRSAISRTEVPVPVPQLMMPANFFFHGEQNRGSQVFNVNVIFAAVRRLEHYFFPALHFLDERAAQPRRMFAHAIRIKNPAPAKPPAVLLCLGGQRLAQPVFAACIKCRGA